MQRKSKRESLVGLPQYWPLKIYDELTDDYKLPFLLLALTGCRPAEIGKGIKIFVQDELLVCIINGAKVSKTKGHTTRSLTFDSQKNIYAKIIHNNFTQDSINEFVVRTPDGKDAKAVKKFCDKVRHTAQRKLGMKGVSAYSLRHQAASDLKYGMEDETEISKVLGHRSLTMKKHYGAKQFGTGGHGIIKVFASEADQMRSSEWATPPNQRVSNSLGPSN